MSTKPHTALDEMSVKGEFKRTDSGFRNFIEEGSQFEPETGRYHLYISFACPWANRCLAAIYLKGLEDCIGVSVTHPTWQFTRPGQDEHAGWAFLDPSHPPVANIKGFGSFDCEGCIPDSVNGAKFIRDLYQMSNDTFGKYSVPVLWDKKHKCIVNNESSEILRMFSSKFNKFAKTPELDLYPEALRDKIDEVNDWVYSTINNGVYRCGFAKTQEAYEVAFRELFQSLDRCEEILSKQRYMVGNQMTEADIRLFMTLIRFDEVYVVYFKTNKKAIHEYPNIREYVKDMYQTPGMASAINMKHIKTHYYTSHPLLNWYAIIPTGGDSWWKEPHDRAKFGQA